ncbi:MAG: hypothetical protein GEV13_05115 [Rhodospirillales bacterium]|nr:hypothetical protein [Rhodospirillales bacterium]
MPFVWDPPRPSVTSPGTESRSKRHGNSIGPAPSSSTGLAVSTVSFRQAAIGLLHGRVCTLIFADRPDGVRLISFRRANRSEEKVYEKVRPRSA